MWPVPLPSLNRTAAASAHPSASTTTAAANQAPWHLANPWPHRYSLSLLSRPAAQPNPRVPTFWSLPTTRLHNPHSQGPRSWPRSHEARTLHNWPPGPRQPCRCRLEQRRSVPASCMSKHHHERPPWPFPSPTPVAQPTTTQNSSFEAKQPKSGPMLILINRS